MYLDVKQPGNAQLAPGMVIIHHVVLHSLWSRDPIIFYMEVSQRCFQTITFLRTMVLAWYFEKCGSFLKYVVLEAVVQRCSLKKVFLEIPQNSQENTFARASFLIKLQASAMQLY